MGKIILVALLLFASNAAAQAIDSRITTVTPAVDTSAYATGEVVGGLLTFTDAVRPTTGAGILIAAGISDKSAQAQDLELVIFESSPSASTLTDQAAFDPADADISKIVAVISFGSGSRFAFSDNGFKYVGSLAYPVRARDASGLVSGTLYGVLVSRGTPTFAAASDVSVRIMVTSD